MMGANLKSRTQKAVSLMHDASLCVQRYLGGAGRRYTGWWVSGIKLHPSGSTLRNRAAARRAACAAAASGATWLTEWPISGATKSVAMEASRRCVGATKMRAAHEAAITVLERESEGRPHGGRLAWGEASVLVGECGLRGRSFTISKSASPVRSLCSRKKRLAKR